MGKPHPLSTEKTFTRPDYRLRATTSHTKKNFRILPGEQNPLPTLSASKKKKNRRLYVRNRLVVSGSIWTAPSRFKHSGRFMSSVPTTIEDLRTKYKVMANMFLLAQMRQPSRHSNRGLEVNAFSDFLDELLSDRNFLMESDDDEKLVIPPWN